MGYSLPKWRLAAWRWTPPCFVKLTCHGCESKSHWNSCPRWWSECDPTCDTRFWVDEMLAAAMSHSVCHQQQLQRQVASTGRIIRSDQISSALMISLILFLCFVASVTVNEVQNAGLVFVFQLTIVLDRFQV